MAESVAMQINNRWDGRTVVIIGDPAHFCPQRMAGFWRSVGLEVAIVTRRWDGPSQLNDGTRILQSVDSETFSFREQLTSLYERWLRVERGLNLWERSRYRAAMGPAEQQDHQPSFADSLLQAASIPQFVSQLDPAFVFGQVAFTYGLATALCAVGPKVLMPWGGDIFSFAETNSVSFAMVQRALNGVDLVVPSGVVGARIVTDRFGVAREKVRAISWGVDRRLFRKASWDRRCRFCAENKIDPRSLIILNVRRLKPRWGCNLALEAFIQLAEQDESLHFFGLGGPGSEPFVAQARERISSKGLNRRIIIFDGPISDSAVQELVSMVDIYTSLVPVSLNDMRSASILEGAAAGATPVLSNIAEYREMERLGFRALFVKELQPEAIVATLIRAIEQPALRAEIAAANTHYLQIHEDTERNQLKLLDMVASLPAPAECSRPHVSEALTTIAEIIGGRRYLGLLPPLTRLGRGCAHPIRGARLVWRDLRAHFSNLEPSDPLV
jgi:glycosyltransferase involved in cell wall biosynthesis